ncbi:MAG: C4-dicarboxylate anaerobic carrier-like protein, partial [Massilibacillus sp.]|nr:C4-dicarboxylate anaerobic carrier-like protein [Massilibacillus sp.]
MIWIGVAIILLTLAAIVKRYETRLVLFLAGLAMALVAGKPLV